ncbi:MAG: response regulator [Elusimicrobiota bacterium]
MIINRNMKKIIYSVIIGIVTAIVVSFVQKPVFESSALLEIKLHSERDKIMENQYGMAVSELIATECKKIKSYSVIYKAAEYTGILYPGIAFDDKNMKIDYLQKHVSAERVKGTNIIQLTARLDSAEGAAGIVNNMVKIYIEKTEDQKIKKGQKVKSRYEEQLDDIGALIEQKRSQIDDLTEKRGFINNANELKTDLSGLKLDQIKLRRKFNYKHPAVIEIQDQIEEVEKELDKAVQKDLILKKIEADEEFREQLKEKYREAMFEDFDNLASMQVISPAVIPVQPLKPDLPVKLLFGGIFGVIFGFILTLKTGTNEVFLRDIEKMENDINIPVLGVIPQIKDKKTAKSDFNFFKRSNASCKIESLRNRLLFNYSAKASVTEAYFTLWMNIKFTLPEKNAGVLLFTGVCLEEEKTLIAVNYAIASAAAGIKTLFIDAGKGESLIRQIFGLPPGGGLSEIIMGKMDWKNAVKDIPEKYGENAFSLDNKENLKIITCGKEENPANMLNSRKMDQFIEQARKEYELIIFDSSALLLSAEPVILSTKVDAVILVHHNVISSGALLKKAKDQLEKVHASIMGIVLNNVRISELYPWNERRISKSREYKKSVSDLEEKKKKKKVLIVDDENNIINIITRLLLKKSKYDYEIASTGDGLDALKQVKALRPDLVILDLKLPGINGFQLCESIHNDPDNKGMKILAITGYDMPGTKERIFRCGADEYMSKPFNLKKFIECVNNLS